MHPDFEESIHVHFPTSRYTRVPCQLGVGWYALYTCKAPSILWTRPKKTVRQSTRTATQNVYHWTLFLRSYQKCKMEVGRGLSSFSFKVMSSSLQNLNISARRSSGIMRSQFSSSRSRYTVFLEDDHSDFNHFSVFLSYHGKKRARVWSVSLARPSGKMVL